jgi:hypothetical protein
MCHGNNEHIRALTNTRMMGGHPKQTGCVLGPGWGNRWTCACMNIHKNTDFVLPDEADHIAVGYANNEGRICQ